MPQSRKQREREYKTFPVAVTGVDEALGIVEAIVAVMGNIDNGDDIIHNGSFVKTISERAKRIRVLDAHNAWSGLDVIGKPLEMRELSRDELPESLLAEYPQATGGFYTKTQYLINTPEGKGIFDRIVAEAISEYSIGFEVMQSDHSTVVLDGQKRAVRNIREIRLWEYSPVIWGMNPATATVGAKGDDGQRDDKEYGPNGKQKRLGDVLKAAVHATMLNKAAYYYSEGYLSADEYAQMNALATEVFDLLQEGIPEDVALRPIDDYYFFFDGGQPDERKQAEASSDEDVASEAGPPSGEESPSAPTCKAMQDELLSLEAELVEIELSEASE